MDYRNKILSLVESHPVLPSEVAKTLGIDSLMSGAMLSEMVSKGLLKVSRFKIGGSPVYFSPKHPDHLLSFIDNLNDKDKKTCILLQEKGVLFDDEQEPLTRVSLKEIKDFAIPLTVTYKEKDYSFFKWFLLADSDAEGIIKDILGISKPSKSASAVDIEKPEEKSVPKNSIPKSSVVDKSSVNTLESNNPKDLQDSEASLQNKNNSESFVDKSMAISGFDSIVESFFSKHNISFGKKSKIRKDDFEYLVRLPTVVGSIDFFCKAKRKKRINDSDLSNALVSGQLDKLPVLFITEGDLTRTAKELLPKLNGFVFKKL